MDIDKWIAIGRRDGYRIMFVLIDFEDRTHYPVYFFSESESKRFDENIISESKCKIIQTYYL